MIEIIKEILTFLKTLFFEKGLRETLAWLIKGSPLILRLAVLFFLFLSIILAVVVVTDISETNNVMNRALSSPIESAPRPNSAIEALLLASVLPQKSSVPADQRGALEGTPKYTPEFSAELQAFKTMLEKSHRGQRIKEEKETNEKPNEKQQVKGKKQKTAKEDPNSLRIVNNNGKQMDLSDTILSDKNDGFLFVPGAILPALEKYDLNSIVSNSYNEGLAQDISVSQRIASIICGTLQENFDGRDVAHSVLVPGTAPDQIMAKYVQAYIVFRSGVARLCENGSAKTWQEQLGYYAKKFTPRTLLQTRFYFEPTVHYGHFSTSPYVDLGGNGVVETFCNSVPIGKKEQGEETVQRTDAILCFDYPLAIDLRTEIRSEITRFGGTATDFVCKDQTNCTRDTTQPAVSLSNTVRFMSLFYPPRELTLLEDREINEKFAYARDHATEATFFGDITILERDPESGVIKFTVPLGDNKILAIKFDVTGYQSWRTLWLCLTVASIAITAILALLILADYGLKLREQERAFNAVDSIMSDVPSPYARLDEDGKFLKVNDAFAQLVGYTSAAEATPELKNYAYEDFLVGDENKEVFHEIKKERRESKKYRSYSVQLWTGRRPGVGLKKWVKVHGGDVPTPTTARNKPGQSFGILIPMDSAPKPIAVIEPKTPPVVPDAEDRSRTA